MAKNVAPPKSGYRVLNSVIVNVNIIWTGIACAKQDIVGDLALESKSVKCKGVHTPSRAPYTLS